MNHLSTRLGFWTALLSAFMFLVFTGCFVGIALSGSVAEWTTLEAYIERSRSSGQTLQYVAQLSMLLFAPLYVLLLNCIHDVAPEEKKILTRVSISFAVAFAVLVSLMYFLQLSTIRIGLQKGQLEGLEQFIQFYPNSAILGAGMLGWTLFFGLSSLFVAPVFTGSRLQKVIRVAFLINGACCLLGGVGFVFETFWLVFLTINFGMGGAVTVVAISVTLFFRRQLSVRLHEA